MYAHPGMRILANAALLTLLLLPRLSWGQGVPPGASTATTAAPKTVTSTAPVALVGTKVGLEQETQDLRALLAGDSTSDIAISSLFEIDLTDEASVERRVTQLRKELTVTSTRAISPVARARRERDRLRLDFLSRPEGERAQLIEAQTQRRRLQDEQQAANQALAEAQAREARAEAARLQALEEVRQARTAAERMLANERARFESSRSALASLEADIAAQRQKSANVLAKELERIQGLQTEAADPELTESSADRLHDEVAQQLVARRADLSKALEDLSLRTGVDAYEPGVDLGGSEFDAVAEARDELHREIEAHRSTEDKLRKLEHRLYQNRANEIGAQVNALNELRLELRPRMSADKRHRLTSLTREGIAQLEREVSHLVLLSRWYFRARLARLFSTDVLFGDMLAVGLASWSVFKVAILVFLALYARKRRREWFAHLRRLLSERSKSHSTSFWVERWVTAFEAVAGELIFLVAVYVVFRVLLEKNSFAELDLAGDLLLAFGSYRFVLAAFHRTVTSAVEARAMSVSAELSERILRSMRLILRYAFGVYIYLTLSERLLGRGNLHGIAASFAWIGVIPIGVVLVARWRASIVNSYLSNHPEGNLANLVRNTRDKKRGFFAALLAFGFVAARGVFVYARETALGFENTRRALAYVFRRRLEKQAETQGRRVTDLNLLPHTLTVACSDEEQREEGLIDHFPMLDKILEEAKAWRSGGPGRTVSLVGDVGMGKSVWMRKLAAGLGGEEQIHTFEQRFVGEAAAIGVMSEALRLGPFGDRDALVIALREAPPRLILFDHCQSLFLRSVGGLGGYEACLEVASRTSDRHFWVLGHSARPWAFLTKVFRKVNHFDSVVELRDWEEEQIAELIDRRMKLAGVTPIFDDLVVDRLVGPAYDREVIRSGDRFRRLLWDYTDGNPRLALHFWLRSLDSDGPGRARVHLFGGPSADDLEHLQESNRFILASLVIHESLTALEASAALAFTPEKCDAALRFLRKAEVLSETNGRYRVSTHWNRAVARFLKRKGLIIA